MAYHKPILTPDWMRLSEAAARLDCDPRTLAAMINRGDLNVRAMRFDGTPRVNRGDFEREIAKRVSLGVSA